MYSQNNEQEVILKYFGDKVGTFIDIGANDGKTLSNTFALSERGWSGVLVEPSPSAFANLKDNYKIDSTKMDAIKIIRQDGINPTFYFYPFALGVTNGTVKMWDSGTHLNKGDTSLLSTLVEKDKTKWEKSTNFTEIEVQCFRWKTFLNRLKFKAFDFISIDAEGLDYEILKQIDLRETSLICVEYNGDANLKLEFDKLMIGFKIIYTSPENLIYAR